MTRIFAILGVLCVGLSACQPVPEGGQGRDCAAMERGEYEIHAKNGSSYVVFFGFDEALLDDYGQCVLDAVSGEMRDAGESGKSVMVNGHTDRSGPDKYNMLLSNARAETVRQALITRGVPEKAIEAYGFGETDPLVPTNDGVREAKNRRAEIAVRK